MASELFGMEAMFAGLLKRGFHPKVVYDVGAAEGGWTRWALNYWPNAEYICFEPLRERELELAQLRLEYPQVKVFDCGLADADESREMGVTDDLYGSSFAYSANRSRLAKIRRLDSIVSQEKLPIADFIKLDIQGYERLALKGGAETIKGAHLILMECTFFAFCQEMATLDQTISFMSERGFIPYEFVDFLRRPYDDAMGQCDILFVNRDHELVSSQSW